MSHRTHITLVVAALALALAPATADATPASNVDHRPCATEAEFDRILDHGTKAEVETFIDTTGWKAYEDPQAVLIKHYRFCDHPHGWLAAAYTPLKGRGWVLHDRLLIFHCEIKPEGSTSWTPCDPSVPCIMEALYFKSKARPEGASDR